MTAPGLLENDGRWQKTTEMHEAVSLVCKRLRQAGGIPLFLAISGSHACNLARADSDIDVRGVYQDATTKVLGLRPCADTIEGTDGTVDFQCYELKKFLTMLLNHNGNAVRLLLGPLFMYELPTSIDWGELGKRFLTKRLRNYYRGYAIAQQKRAMSHRGGRALIYTYREIFEGLAVMRLGYPLFDFRELWNYVCMEGFYPNRGLLDDYFGDFSKPVSDEGWHMFYSEWEILCTLLDEEVAKSPLPDNYDGFGEINAILLERRLKFL